MTEPELDPAERGRRVLEEWRAREARRRELARNRERIPGPIRRIVERMFGSRP